MGKAKRLQYPIERTATPEALWTAWDGDEGVFAARHKRPHPQLCYATASARWTRKGIRQSAATKAPLVERNAKCGKLATHSPLRLRMLHALAAGEKYLGRLARICGTHGSTVSQHLALLKASGWVEHRERSLPNFYRYPVSAKPPVRGWLFFAFQAKHIAPNRVLLVLFF